MARHGVAVVRLLPLGRILLCAAVTAACIDFPSAPGGQPDVEGWVTRLRVQDSVTRVFVEESSTRSHNWVPLVHWRERIQSAPFLRNI